MRDIQELTSTINGGSMAFPIRLSRITFEHIYTTFMGLVHLITSHIKII
jgi:hypothetical protein